MQDQSHIRNFSIIAHIDHGKSTLADRILERTHAVAERDLDNQMLDNMDIERERGITIKARAVHLTYRAQNGEDYYFNLIDTPGHVDFNYEVSRSLKACEGAILIVDATQGVEAQTLGNAYLAIDNNLEVLPVINKIDLPSADVPKTQSEIEDIIGIPAEGCPAVSAKTGKNIDEVLEHIVSDIPAPSGDPDAPLKALIFDSYYDPYLGVVVNLRVFDGVLRTGMRIRLMSTGAVFDVVGIGTMEPFGLKETGILSAGDVGYLTASIKSVSETRVGDTVTTAEGGADQPLPGFKQIQPMVYSGIYPADSARYPELREALEKLRLNDASLTFEPETSAALGFGFRCGFLGLLHMEIIEERLEREFNLDLITTVPSVIYKIRWKNGDVTYNDKPPEIPTPDAKEAAEEPIVKSNNILTTEYTGSIMQQCQE
ncbi:MAG: translation elongation factor 4, partial [Clostridia bacterium]|nr:translation elongation factor 4 [Clostridia bacterium]